MGFDQHQPPSARRPRRKARFWVVLGAGIAVIAASVAFVAVTSTTQAAEAEAQSSASSKAASSRSAEATRLADLAKAKEAEAFAASQSAADVLRAQESAAKARADSEIQQMAAQGWQSVGNQLYYQFLDHALFTCGSWKCSYLNVVSMSENGCPGGIYIAVSIDRGKVSIGSTNAFTAGLPKAKVARVKLEDSSNQGEGFQLTEMNCH